MQAEFAERSGAAGRESGDPSSLDHELNPHFEHLASLSSTAELLRDPVFRSIQPEVDKVLNSVDSGCFGDLPGAGGAGDPSRILATAWNIERGIRLDGIIPTLQHH